MVETAQPFIPEHPGSIDELRQAAQVCKGCSLYIEATQTVFGAGSARPKAVIVGEQPGDMEDREGVPFVGPAGRLLHKAMADAGLHEGDVYLTNAVKHFRHVSKADTKRRIHARPRQTEIAACRPWLVAEFALLQPRLVIALGATAAQTLLGDGFRVSQSGGQIMTWEGPGDVMATMHPASVLRAKDRVEAYQSFVADLRVAAQAIG